MLETRDSVTEIKTAFSGFIKRRGSAKERISELEKNVWKGMKRIKP